MADSAPDVTIFWRPGCVFCSSMIRQLKRLNVGFSMRNIWDDPEAAAFVRSVARGNETVPTVTVGSHAFVNPSADVVIRAMEKTASA